MSGKSNYGTSGPLGTRSPLQAGFSDYSKSLPWLPAATITLKKKNRPSETFSSRQPILDSFV